MPIDSLALLREMLEVESLSGQEAYQAALLTRRMAELGLQTSVDEAGNVVGIRSTVEPSAQPAREIVLLGHMDTVPGRIPVRMDGGRLYGRGAVDAKGSLAAFIMAAASAEICRGTRLVVVGAVEEEAPSSRGAHFAKGRYHPDACIIGEPSGWDAVTLGYKGRLVSHYRLQRPSGHSAGPTASVAEEAVRWWLDVCDITRRLNQGRAQLFEQITPTLQNIHTEGNGLRDLVQATVSFRLPPGVDVEALEEELSPSARDGELAFTSEIAAYRGKRDTPLARAFLRAIREYGGRPSFKLKTGTSDMNVVGPVWGCPIVAYGPGDSRLDHTPDEHVVIDDYLRAIEVLKRVLAEMSG